jgi:endonuclease YncB( thermonuclease family)
MKRTLVLLLTLALLVTACASSGSATSGVITSVDRDSVTVSTSTGQTTTYALAGGTNVYAPNGERTQRSYLTAGQRVQVWAQGEKALRINIDA